MCDGWHVHKVWGVDADNNFATAEEAEYPGRCVISLFR